MSVPHSSAGTKVRDGSRAEKGFEDRSFGSRPWRDAAQLAVAVGGAQMSCDDRETVTICTPSPTTVDDSIWRPNKFAEIFPRVLGNLTCGQRKPVQNVHRRHDLLDDHRRLFWENLVR